MEPDHMTDAQKAEVLNLFCAAIDVRRLFLAQQEGHPGKAAKMSEANFIVQLLQDCREAVIGEG